VSSAALAQRVGAVVVGHVHRDPHCFEQQLQAEGCIVAAGDRLLERRHRLGQQPGEAEAVDDSANAEQPRPLPAVGIRQRTCDQVGGTMDLPADVGSVGGGGEAPPARGPALAEPRGALQRGRRRGVAAPSLGALRRVLERLGDVLVG